VTDSTTTTTTAAAAAAAAAVTTFCYPVVVVCELVMNDVNDRLRDVCDRLGLEHKVSRDLNSNICGRCEGHAEASHGRDTNRQIQTATQRQTLTVIVGNGSGSPHNQVQNQTNRESETSRQSTQGQTEAQRRRTYVGVLSQGRQHLTVIVDHAAWAVHKYGPHFDGDGLLLFEAEGYAQVGGRERCHGVWLLRPCVVKREGE
jgi:hypothetical protein